MRATKDRQNGGGHLAVVIEDAGLSSWLLSHYRGGEYASDSPSGFVAAIVRKYAIEHGDLTEYVRREQAALKAAKEEDQLAAFRLRVEAEEDRRRAYWSRR